MPFVSVRKRYPTKNVRKPAPGARRPSVFLLIVAVLSGGAVLYAVRGMRLSSSRDYAADVVSDPRLVSVGSYVDLLALPPATLAEVDIGLVNWLCAEGLPGSASSDTPAILAKLDEWAERVRSETERHLYRVTDPRYADHYGHSEARLRAEFLVQVLQEDCGILGTVTYY